MKKILFAASLAIVAIGGALTSKADNYYNAGATVTYSCNIAGATSCTLIPEPIYDTATVANQNGTTLVDRTSLVGQFYN